MEVWTCRDAEDETCEGHRRGQYKREANGVVKEPVSSCPTENRSVPYASEPTLIEATKPRMLLRWSTPD